MRQWVAWWGYAVEETFFYLRRTPIQFHFACRCEAARHQYSSASRPLNQSVEQLVYLWFNDVGDGVLMDERFAKKSECRIAAIEAT